MTSRSPALALVDAGAVLALVALGLYGLRPVYGGVAYLLVGVLGAALGIAITELAQRLRQPVLAEVAVTVITFLLLGGAVAARAHTLAHILPSLSTVSSLGHVGVYGWKELLTTAPPVGDSSELLALPYLIGLLGGVAGQSIARRTRRAAPVLLGPAAVLGLSILFGARQPASILLQGALWGGVALAWVAARARRNRPVLGGTHRAGRPLVTAVVMLGAASAVAAVVGPRLPGAGSHQRVVLSRYVVPPFDANDEPSPLAGFRSYTKGAPATTYASVLFSVQGLEPGAMVRIAAMDAYNGVVWGFGAGLAGTGSGQGSDTFRRFGAAIPAGVTGQAGHVVVTIGALGGVWMPEIGDLTRASFIGDRSGDEENQFRYDPSTATAAEIGGLRPGERYRIDAVIPSYPSASVLRGAGAGLGSVTVDGVSGVVQSDASGWTSSVSGAWQRVMAIASHLKAGEYSDGTESPPLADPGHTAGRLAQFLQGGPLVGRHIVGDDEQYAAALAVMANQAGVPARVVLGASVEPGGVVRGRDVHAWVEVALSGLGWVPVYANQFVPTTPAHETPPVTQPDAAASAPVEPPLQSAIHSPLQPLFSDVAADTVGHHSTAAPFRLPAWLRSLLEWGTPPLFVALAAASAVLTLKRNRRHRRRHAAHPAAALAGGWSELVDVARDLGTSVGDRSTRSEQAAALPLEAAEALARRADAAVFGPTDPTADQVAQYWRSIDEQRTALLHGVGRLRRWRTRLSLRSLAPQRAGGSRPGLRARPSRTPEPAGATA